MNLATAFTNCAEKHAGKVAIFWGEREISYAELLAQSQSVAARLQNQLGVKPGDRVALWLKNCPEFVPCVFGILQAGAVVVPINNFLKPVEVAYILDDGGVDVVITDAELGAHSAELKTARPSLKFFQIEEIAAREPPDSRFPIPARKRIWPSSFTPPARRANPRARCSRTATCCTMSRAAAGCWP